MSSNTTTTPTGFFSLPAEIRNVIYAHVLEDGPSIHITGDANHTPSIPLLEAHPLIASEAGPMQLSHRTFHFDFDEADDSYDGAQELSKWLLTLGPSGLRTLNRVTISHADRFTLTLHRETVNDKSTFIIENLTMATDKPWVYPNRPFATFRLPSQHPLTAPYDDRFIRASINQAISSVYLDDESDIKSSCEHNLVNGLARFLLHCDNTRCWDFHTQAATALQFVTGETMFMKRYIWMMAETDRAAAFCGIYAVNAVLEERRVHQMQALPVPWRPWYEPCAPNQDDEDEED
ncbi:hypothetical protein LTR10_011352 [Elasticomyces elasticus]|nr:hypothetical protein LTR10_011352 [Elasticomyces elasticus]KAK4966236.1 hypothetical protein LTR42_011397 [Elasticomyces elasticus]